MGQLHGQRCVQNVGGSQTLVHPARGGPDGCSHVLEKCDDIVIRPLFNLGDLGDGKARPLSYFLRINLRDLAQLGHGLAGERFDLEPDFKFSSLRPKIAHLRAGIAIDHRRKIRARGRLEKRFSRQKKRRSDGTTHRSDVRKMISALAD